MEDGQNSVMLKFPWNVMFMLIMEIMVISYRLLEKVLE